MLPNDLENLVCRYMEDVFDAGHKVRLASGRNTEEWRGKSVRKHLAHALAHIEHVLDSRAPEHEIIHVLDDESKTPELANAMLRLAFAIYIAFEKEQRQEMKVMREDANNE